MTSLIWNWNEKIRETKNPSTSSLFRSFSLHSFQLHLKTCKRFIIEIIRFENDVPKHTHTHTCSIQSGMKSNHYNGRIFFVLFFYSSILLHDLPVIFIWFSIAILFTLYFHRFCKRISGCIFMFNYNFFSPFICYVFSRRLFLYI